MDLFTQIFYWGYNDMIARVGAGKSHADMRFVQNFTQPDFQAKTFTPKISPNFNSVSESGEIYTAGKNFYTATGSDGRDKSHLCSY